jgi:hypothetical protein
VTAAVIRPTFARTRGTVGRIGCMSPVSAYYDSPPPAGREAIFAAGSAVDGLPLSTTQELRAAIPIARTAADTVTRVSRSQRWDMGRLTGMRIAKFQNWLYEQNREWHFRDETLCVLWCLEFPDAKSDYCEHLHYIDSTRRDYNAGKHQARAPNRPCVAYDRRVRTV